MSRKEFKDLKTFADWKKKLDALLGEADALVADETLQPRRDVAERLTEFQEYSPDDIAEVEHLDSIAEHAREAIVLGTIDQRLAGIGAATSALRTLAKDLDRQAEEDRASAAAIRLEGMRGTLKSVNETLAAAMELEKNLDSATDQQFAGQLKKVLDSLIGLRDSIEEKVRA